jgi:hypothetical protein
MQRFIKTISILAMLAITVVSSSAIAKEVSAKKGKSYEEQEFLASFSGKSRAVVMEKLGAPSRKEQSVKPTNAGAMMVGKGQESSKPVNVEMWYYNGVVNYAPKKAYKFTELTFVNDRCMNIAFFNNK